MSKNAQPKVKTQRDLDDAELVERNPERPGQLRPKSMGATYCMDPSLTDQSQKDHCDLNQIARRYEAAGGTLPRLMADLQFTQAGMAYGDFSDARDFVQATQIVTHAQEQFEKLAPDLRNRFNGDPAEFLKWVSDEKNNDEHVKLGFAKPKKQAEVGLKDLQQTLKDGFSGALKPAGKGEKGGTGES